MVFHGFSLNTFFLEIACASRASTSVQIIDFDVLL